MVSSSYPGAMAEVSASRSYQDIAEFNACSVFGEMPGTEVNFSKG